ncbi:Beta-Galactosidase-1-Like Protein 2 [Manis pentadactyla]|nr:Beta-Galactosidase-1-Like Protein 2 [Manis pentadactyla]
MPTCPLTRHPNHYLQSEKLEGLGSSQMRPGHLPGWVGACAAHGFPTPTHSFPLSSQGPCNTPKLPDQRANVAAATYYELKLLQVGEACRVPGKWASVGGDRSLRASGSGERWASVKGLKACLQLAVLTEGDCGTALVAQRPGWTQPVSLLEEAVHLDPATYLIYVPWNLHEPERGTFDFSGNLDLEAFVLMAAEIGLWVILRPGPYICSEIDLGGLPSWLLQNPNLKLRTINKGVVEAVDKYFDHLISIVVPLQYLRGGPITAVQVENEYGSFNKDKDYMPSVQQVRNAWPFPIPVAHIRKLTSSSINWTPPWGAKKDAEAPSSTVHIETSEQNGLGSSGNKLPVLATVNMKMFQKNAFKQLYEVQAQPF